MFRNKRYRLVRVLKSSPPFPRSNNQKTKRSSESIFELPKTLPAKQPNLNDIPKTCTPRTSPISPHSYLQLIQISACSTKARHPFKMGAKSTHLCLKPTFSPNFIPVYGSERKKPVLRGANQGEPPPPPPPRELRLFLTLPASSSQRACPQPPLRVPSTVGAERAPPPPTRVRSPPHGAAGPSVSAREEGERRRRRLRLTSPPPPSLPFSPPPGPSASEEGQEPFWELSFAPSPPTHLSKSSPQSDLNRVKLRMKNQSTRSGSLKPPLGLPSHPKWQK